MSYERPPDSQPRGDRPTREWIQLAAAVVGLLAAIAAGTFGILANKAKVDAQVTTSTAQKQAGAAQAQIDNLNKQLAQEQAANEDLRSQLAAQSSTAPAAPLTGSDPADVYHTGKVTIAPGRTIDLDATPSDPQWGELGNDGDEIDVGWEFNCDGICLGDGSTDFVNSDDRLIAPASATKATCDNNTGYEKGPISITKVKKGLTVCVITNQGRTSIFQVIATTGPSEPIQLKLTTYAKPGD